MFTDLGKQKGLVFFGVLAFLVVVIIILVVCLDFNGEPSTGAELLASVPFIVGKSEWSKILQNGSDKINALPSDPWDLQGLTASTVNAQLYSVGAANCSQAQYKDAVAQTLSQIDVMIRAFEKYENYFKPAASTSDIYSARLLSKIAGFLAVDGGYALDSRLSTLRDYYRLGVRCVALGGLCSTPWSKSSVDNAGVDTTLDIFGQNVVEEMNRLGVLIDLTGSNSATQLQTIQLSKAPVIFTASSSSNLTSHPMNVDDAVLQALVSTFALRHTDESPTSSAVCGITQGVTKSTPGIKSKGLDPLVIRVKLSFTYLMEESVVTSKSSASCTRLAIDDGLLHKGAKGGLVMISFTSEQCCSGPTNCTVATIVEHINHIANIAGKTSVGIGGDVGMSVQYPQGITNSSGFTVVFDQLLSGGEWTVTELQNLAGNNFIRVMENVEQVAKTMKEEGFVPNETEISVDSIPVDDRACYSQDTRQLMAIRNLPLTDSLLSFQSKTNSFQIVTTTVASTETLDSSSTASPENPSSSTLSPGNPSSSTASPGDPSSSTASTGNPSSSTASPGNPSSSTASPGNPSSSTASPGAPSSSTASPGNPSSSTASPENPSSSTASPGNPSSSTASPENPSSSTVSPENPSSSTVSPENPSSSTVSPENPSSSTVSPGNPSSSTVSPENPSSSTVSPGNPSSSTDSAGSLTPETPSPGSSTSHGYSYINKYYGKMAFILSILVSSRDIVRFLSL